VKVNWQAALLVLAVLAAVSGCAEQPAQRPAVLAAAVITANTATLWDSWRLGTAEDILDQRCMHEHGFDYLIEPDPQPSAGIVTEDAIGTGRPATYGVPTPQAGPPAEDQYVNGLAEPLRSRYLTALDGSAGPLGTITMPSGAVDDFLTGGCIAQARVELYGNLRAGVAALLTPSDVTTMFGRFLTTDHDYQSALTSWQQCMAAAGWHVHSPAEAILNLEKLTSAQQLASEQPAEAAADVTCDGRSHLRDRTSQARGQFLAVQPGVVGQLVDVYRTLQHALAVAATLTS
jgi:hypothetical protein